MISRLGPLTKVNYVDSRAHTLGEHHLILSYQMVYILFGSREIFDIYNLSDRNVTAIAIEMRAANKRDITGGFTDRGRSLCQPAETPKLTSSDSPDY